MKPGGTCPYCCRQMVRPSARVRRGQGRALPEDMVTVDHIVPRAWGGADIAENRRPCCRRCNELRAQLGHCVGALACLLAVSRDGRWPRNPRSVAISWRRLPQPARTAL